MAKLISVNVGLPREVDWHGRRVRTSIWKAPVQGRIRVEGVNLEGDRQSDLSVHGGRDKAVYVYPSEHYKQWRRELAGLELPWGAFGENFTVAGLLETTVKIGDHLLVGSAEFSVTQPRLPCFKLGIRFGRDAMVQHLFESGRTGFYLAVVREGDVGSGDAIELTPGDNEGASSVADLFVNLTKSLSGYGNLVMDSNQFLQGTLTADPHLAPLAWRGGYTRTHAPNEGSPVIDHGSNPHNLEYDQRFGYGFDANPRQWGGATDIGAYERRPFDDQLFYDGFN